VVLGQGSPPRRERPGGLRPRRIPALDLPGRARLSPRHQRRPDPRPAHPHRPPIRRRRNRHPDPPETAIRWPRARPRQPHTQRPAAIPSLPRRTRIRPAQPALAHPPAHHHQPQQDHPDSTRRPRPHPLRAQLHQMTTANSLRSPQCLGMKNSIDLSCVPSDHLVPSSDQLRLAVAACLARFKGASCYHTESGLRCCLAWCADHGLDSLAERRPHLELYIGWMQEIGRLRPSTVSRRFPVAAGFCRTCVIDGLLEHSPAGHVGRPSVRARSPRPWGSPTCSSRRCSPLPGNHRTLATSRWPPRSGSPACGSSKLPALTSPTPAKSTVTGSCAYAAKAPRSSWFRYYQPSAGPSTRLSAPAPTARSFSTAAVPGQTATPPPSACAGSRDCWCADHQAAPAHAPPHFRHDHAGRGRGPAGCSDRRPPCGSTDNHALRPGS
jgi:hypothetical protein